MRRICALTIAALVGLGGVSFAQTSHHGHGAQQAADEDSPATRAYRAANDKMHKGMDIRFGGDADVDFVRGMIPHHEGAIAMAEVVLQHGKDEQIRKWATDIIREQRREISEMQEWLKMKGH